MGEGMRGGAGQWGRGGGGGPRGGGGGGGGRARGGGGGGGEMPGKDSFHHRTPASQPSLPIMPVNSHDRNSPLITIVVV